MLSAKFKLILRWIALPFATVIGALLASILLALFQWISLKMWGGISEDSWYYRYILPFISSIFFGYFYSIISLKVAPESKVIASTVMVTLLGVLSSFSLYLAWEMKVSHGFRYFIETLFGVIGTMSGAIVALVNHEEHI